jgi:hypothetical protein
MVCPCTVQASRILDTALTSGVTPRALCYAITVVTICQKIEEWLTAEGSLDSNDPAKDILHAMLHEYRPQELCPTWFWRSLLAKIV